MDKTNKYYKTIENLVKQHKKYGACEAILDEIIDDVYAHSETVINSISDEGVINAYLTKVVSTSIITVPKKMNFNTNVPHRVVVTQQPVLETQNVNKTLVDKMINAPETTVDEHFFESTETLSNTQDEITEEDLDESLSEDENTGLSLEIQEPEIETTEEFQEVELEPQTENLVEFKDEEPTEDFSENLSEDLNESLSEDENTGLSLEIQEPEIETTEEFQEVELEPQTENLAELKIEEPTEEFSEDLSEDLGLEVQNEEFLQDDTSLQLEEFSEVTENINLEISNNDDNGLLVEESSFSDSLIGEDDNDDSLLNYEESADLQELSTDEASESLIDEESNEPEDFLSTEEQSGTGFNYSVFNYMPQNFKEEIDTEVLVGKLNKLNDLQPDLHIYQVYTLKYKENLTVAEISQQLQVSENSVIDALDKIVSLI